MSLSSSPPHIIVCQFLSSGDVGPFPITETQRSGIMAPSCREEVETEAEWSHSSPLFELYTVLAPDRQQSWRRLSEPLWRSVKDRDAAHVHCTSIFKKKNDNPS